MDSQCPGCLGQAVVTFRLPCAILESPRRHRRVLCVNITSRSRSIKRRQWKHKLDYYGVVFAHLATGCGINAKDPSGWIQIGESRTGGVARIPLGLKPSRDSRATSQRDSSIWFQLLGVFRSILLARNMYGFGSEISFVSIFHWVDITGINRMNVWMAVWHIKRHKKLWVNILKIFIFCLTAKEKHCAVTWYGIPP